MRVKDLKLCSLFIGSISSSLLSRSIDAGSIFILSGRVPGCLFFASSWFFVAMAVAGNFMKTERNDFSIQDVLK